MRLTPCARPHTPPNPLRTHKNTEYTPEAYKRRAFLTNFNGSAGTAVVTATEAFLWTDSRYWNEAGMQLDAEHWTLQKQGLPSTPSIPKWLATRAIEHVKGSAEPLKVGIDPFVHAASFAKELQEAWEEAAKDEFDNVDYEIVIGILDTSHDNLIDPIWGQARPPIPTSPFRVHPLEFAGTSMQEKVDRIREEMKEKKATLAVFCTLDDVAYLMNMRAMGDIETYVKDKTKQYHQYL